jgi:DNA-binding transcriptional MerR regulator
MTPHQPAPRRSRADPSRGVYGISTAADLVGSAPQSLRNYESAGLLTPHRSPGGTRRYSEQDLDRLRDIGDLLDAGLNLAGVVMVLELRADNDRLRLAAGETVPDGDGPAPGGRSPRA